MHERALAAMQTCRTEHSPVLVVRCAACGQYKTLPHSCGHRNCPHCQHHEEVFRAKWFQALKDEGMAVSATIPSDWVVDCKHVGRGDKALTYLGKYLYRGVLQEKDILSCKNGEVTFRYTENTGKVKIVSG